MNAFPPAWITPTLGRAGSAYRRARCSTCRRYITYRERRALCSGCLLSPERCSCNDKPEKRRIN